jgi:chaperonin GroES
MATIEQGMKVFTAVYKRIYRSLASEFRKLYLLNREYMNPEEYVDVLDEPVPQSDYFGSENDVVPSADPNAVSAQEKQAKVQALMQILQLGTIDPMYVTQQYLEAYEIPNAERAIRQPPPQQPDPKAQALQMKAAIDQQKAQSDITIAQKKMEMEQASKEQEMAMKSQIVQTELQAKQMEAILKARAAQQETVQSHIDHRQQLQHADEKHKQQLIQAALNKAQQTK